MADDLDDIFGAIDGDEEIVESVLTENIHIKEDNGRGKGDEEKGPTKSRFGGDGDGGDVGMVEAKQTVGTTQLYNSIMYAQTTSQLRDQIGASGVPDKDAKKKEQEAEQHAATNKVNTGTSHDKSVRSYSAYPKNLPEGMELPKPKKMDKPAKEYPFTLDPFQAQAVGYIESEESVLVAAHTSAGKTAVAEYAIAKALNNGQRVVYTSPIKVSTSSYNNEILRFSSIWNKN